MLLNNATFLLLAFAFGVIAKSLFILKPSKSYFEVLTASHIFFILILFKTDFELNISLFSATLIFIVSLAFFFRDQLMSKITERTLLMFSLIFMYVLFTFSDIWNSDLYSLIFLFSFPVSIILLNFINLALSKIVKFIFYFWFLCVNVYLSSIILFRSYSYSQLNAQYLSNISFLEAFLLGFNLFYLIVNLMYILYIIPIPGKNQTIQERIANVKEHILAMIQKHSDTQTKSWEAIILIILIGGVFFVNNYLKFMSEENLLLSFLTITQIIDREFIIKA